MKQIDQFLDSCRNLVRQPVNAFAKGLNTLTGGRLSPNTVTLTSLAAHVYIAWLIADQQYFLAGVLLVVFGLFDALDGALARLQNSVSNKGMLLDSITDRIKEVLLYVSAAYGVIGTTGRPYLAVWAVSACGTALLVSYINAWAEAMAAKNQVEHKVNQTFRGGIGSFDIRIFVFIIGLLFDRIDVALIVITVLAAWTALERTAKIFSKT